MLCEAAMKVWLGLWSHLGLMGRGGVGVLLPSPCDYWQNSVSHSGRTEGLMFVLAVT